MLLEGKNAVITGVASTRGIGFATAKLFAAHGARCAVVDLNGAAAVARAAALGTDHLGFGGDLADKEAVEALGAKIIDAFGHVDLLVNNAGISRPQRIMDITPAMYDAVMDANMRTQLYMTQAILPTMRARGQGAIVCIGSVAAQRGGGIFGGSHYCASKGADMSFARALARELGPEGIRVNAIAPGMIDTEIFGDAMSAAQRAQVLAAVPLGRLGHADDVAGACLYLCSDLAAWVTGATLDVNGGAQIQG